ncbi:MAG: FCD domain-containing protein, partial [Pseudomonadota bacterium]
MRTFFQTAPMVYAGIARMAAERAERREIAALKDIQLGFARAVSEGDFSDASLLNHRFHAQIG